MNLTMNDNDNNDIENNISTATIVPNIVQVQAERLATDVRDERDENIAFYTKGCCGLCIFIFVFPSRHYVKLIH